jgi:rhodanese-related sulfurtransferase
MLSLKTMPEYAGDLDSAEAWSVLRRDTSARLVDVRTAAEWAYVGTPHLASLGRELLRVEWQNFPAGTANPDFVTQTSEALARSGAGKDAPVLFICRSGARSRAAAIAMTKAGYTRCYNVSGGFEGDLDGEGHRGKTGGWKTQHLPWKQN